MAAVDRKVNHVKPLFRAYNIFFFIPLWGCSPAAPTPTALGAPLITVVSVTDPSFFLLFFYFFML